MILVPINVSEDVPSLVFADYPKAFEGFPIALVTAGLMALAFMGFSGLKVW